MAALCTQLDDRGVVAVTGPDAVAFLENLATNALDDLEVGAARFAALLTPQGKILFEFFAVRTDDGFLLDTLRSRVADLTKRLVMYRLRAKVDITDLSAGTTVYAVWWTPPGATPTSFTYTGTVRASFADPREPRLGLWLLLAGADQQTPLLDLDGAAMTPSSAYTLHRLSLGVPEAGLDYALGDTFPHEANYDLLAGVSFTKGCFVGQEVVARMQNKTVVRKRAVLLRGPGVVSGSEVKAGDAVVGLVGSAVDGVGIAMVRLDRVAEALDQRRLITADGIDAVVDPAAVARYRQSVLDKPVVDL
jgi:hypothetical protein